MSRLGVYDNWGRLVGAVTEREELQRLAFCDSFSSTSSSASAAASVSRLSSVSSSFNYATLELDLVTEQSRPRASFAPSNNANTQANGQGGVAAFLFAAPLAYYRRKKLQREYDLLEANYFFDVPVWRLNQLERFSLAVIDREKLQQLAFCDSFSSTSSSVSSSFNYATLVANELDLVAEPSRPRARFAPSNNTSTHVNGRGGVAAFLFAAPLAYYRRMKSQEYDKFVSKFFFDVPVRQLDQLERFSLGELNVATDDFSYKSILGRDGFGNVYKGRLADGSLVAVIRLISDWQNGDNQFHAEIKVKLNMGEQHPNVLQLRGFCLTATERILVYPYMANRTVRSCLRERTESQPPLDWPTREQIALGSARGIAYLHKQCDQKIIHCNITAANILLNEDFEAVIGDFGCATLMNQEDTEHVKTVIVGTLHHMAPEYLCYGKVSEKTDVFGYGVMLLELAAGDLARLASDEDVRLQDWVKGLLNEKRLEALVDADLRGNYIYGKVEKLVQVALLCCHQGSPEKRPDMYDVVQMLQGDDGLAERWHEYCHEEEILPQESSYALPDTDWSNGNSTSSVDGGEFELSGPR